MADYDEALRRNANVVGGWVDRGLAKADQGDFIGALADYEQALAIGLVTGWLSCSRTDERN